MDLNSNSANKKGHNNYRNILFYGSYVCGPFSAYVFQYWQLKKIINNWWNGDLCSFWQFPFENSLAPCLPNENKVLYIGEPWLNQLSLVYDSGQSSGLCGSPHQRISIWFQTPAVSRPWEHVLGEDIKLGISAKGIASIPKQVAVAVSATCVRMCVIMRKGRFCKVLKEFGDLNCR